MTASLFAIILAALISQSAPLPHVIMETDLGQFDIELDAVKAPISVANFLAYVDAGAYDEGFFHRTVRPDTESRTDYPIQLIHAAFGRVVSGMDVIKKIHGAPINESATGSARQTLTPPIKILKAYRK